MALRPPRNTFSHKRTVRLLVDNDMSLDALSIVKSLPDFQEKSLVWYPNLGGSILTSL